MSAPQLDGSDLLNARSGRSPDTVDAWQHTLYFTSKRHPSQRVMTDSSSDCLVCRKDPVLVRSQL